jgi:type IV pilus assembly protein PilF
MQKRTWLAAALAVALVTPVLADQRSDAEAYVEFGIEVALKGLWEQAANQFEKAVAIDDTYAAAWNDLAIAYETLGEFDKARTAYEKAISLDAGNTFFRDNYDLFREIYDRQNRRRGR